MMQRVDNPEQDISTTWRKFSEVWAVASRNSLYRILAISVALGARQRAKSSSQAPLYVLGWGGEGGDCYCELPRIPLPRTWVNKPPLSMRPASLGGIMTVVDRPILTELGSVGGRRPTRWQWQRLIPMGCGSTTATQDRASRRCCYCRGGPAITPRSTRRPSSRPSTGAWLCSTGAGMAARRARPPTSG